jgi:hypothetical protein
VVWHLVGASVTGQRHLTEGAACQDAHGHRQLCGGLATLVAVADGAGSCSHSRHGAQAAVQAFLTAPALEAWLTGHTLAGTTPTREAWAQVAREQFRGALEAVREAAAAFPQEPLEAFSCTAILAVATERFLAIAHVGDGRACASFTPDLGDWTALFEPERGDAPNETCFLTMERELDAAYWLEESHLYPAGTAFAVLSDGCERGSFLCAVPRPDGPGLFDPNLPFDKFFPNMARGLRDSLLEGDSPEALEAEWTRLLATDVEAFRQESDDRTMVLGVWLPPR